MFTQVNGVPGLEILAGWTEVYQANNMSIMVRRISRTVSGEIRFVDRFERTLLSNVLQCGSCATAPFSDDTFWSSMYFARIPGRNELQLAPETVPTQWTSWDDFAALSASAAAQYEKSRDIITAIDTTNISSGITLKNGVIPSGETKIAFPDYFFPYKENNSFLVQSKYPSMALGSTGIFHIAMNRGRQDHQYLNPTTKTFVLGTVDTAATLPFAISYWSFSQKEWVRTASAITQYLSSQDDRKPWNYKELDKKWWSIGDMAYSATERKFYVSHTAVFGSEGETPILYRISEDALTQP